MPPLFDFSPDCGEVYHYLALFGAVLFSGFPENLIYKRIRHYAGSSTEIVHAAMLTVSDAETDA